MNRIHALAIGTILSVALTLHAQQPAASPNTIDKSGPAAQDVPNVDDQVKVLTAKLDLTVDQQAKVQQIFQELHDVQLKAVTDPNLTHEQRLAMVRPQRMKAHDQICAILNDDQNKRFDEYLQGPHTEMHGKLTGAASSQPTQN